MIIGSAMILGKILMTAVTAEAASRMLGVVNEKSGKDANAKDRAAKRSKARGDYDHLSDDSKLAMLDEEADKIDREDYGVKADSPGGKAFYRGAARGNKAKTEAVKKSKDFYSGDKKPRL